MGGGASKAFEPIKKAFEVITKPIRGVLSKLGPFSKVFDFVPITSVAGVLMRGDRLFSGDPGTMFSAAFPSSAEALKLLGVDLAAAAEDMGIDESLLRQEVEKAATEFWTGGVRSIGAWVRQFAGESGTQVGRWLEKLFAYPLAFFENVFALGRFIAQTSSDVAANPFAALCKLAVRILGIAIGVVLVIWYAIMELGPARAVGAALSWLGALAIVLAGTLAYAAIWALATAVFALIWVVNLVVGSAFLFLLRCENAPDAWFKQSGIEAGNAYRRAVACWRPCAPGWQRTMGLCRRQIRSRPHLCPQQQIFGYYESPASRRGDRPYMFDGYLPDARFYWMRADEKRAEILKAFDEKRRFLGRCIAAGEERAFLSRHVCASVDVLSADEFTDEDRDRMRALCKQAHCDYGTFLAENGDVLATSLLRPGRPSWCSEDARGPPVLPSRPDPKREFLVALLLLVIGTIGLFALVTIKGYAVDGLAGQPS